MAEYIEREALLEKRYNANDISNLPFENMVVDVRDIEDAPTADVVEVVRCKDCKRCYEKRTKRNKQLMRFCMRMDGNEHQVNADDFCSYGERREDR